MPNCQQNSHSFIVSEVPGTRREITEYGSEYSEYQVDRVTIWWEVKCVCEKCGYTEFHLRNQHKTTFINGREQGG